ncbi:MAG TPA: hypothetical protein VLA67_06285 [Nitrospiraceae bacterium]|nr:hypothetical protein [Nitrospiraceae bacterium]
MPGKTTQRLFVIVSGSKQQTEAGACYLANDGSLTFSKSNAARFLTFWGAKEFAEINHIVLTAQTYIDREEFTESDRQDSLIESERHT